MFTPTSQTRNRVFTDVFKRVLDSDFSFEEITIASGAGILKLGTVLGQITATGKFVLHDNAANDGSQNAAAILGEAVDATAADVRCLGATGFVIVSLPELTFKAGISGPNKTAALAALAGKKILARDV